MMPRKEPAWITRLKAQRDAPEPVEVRPSSGKDPEDMSDEELQTAVRRQSEELPRLQFEEMKAMELALASGEVSSRNEMSGSGPTLADVLRERKRSRRRRPGQYA
jgi:hypothetical protein